MICNTDNILIVTRYIVKKIILYEIVTINLNNI